VAFVITGACGDCVYTSCVEECPVEAIYSENYPVIPNSKEPLKGPKCVNSSAA